MFDRRTRVFPSSVARTRYGSRQTLAIRNLTGSGAERILRHSATSKGGRRFCVRARSKKIELAHDLAAKPPTPWRIMRRPARADIVSLTDDQPAPMSPRPKPPRRLRLARELVLPGVSP